MERNPAKLKRETDTSMIVAEGLNTALSLISGTSRQTIKRNTDDLNLTKLNF